MSSEQTCLQGFANDYIYHLSLRGSVATAAIRWNKIRSIYRVLFQGDRHANARDDTENKPSLREKKNQKLNTRETNGTRTKKNIAYMQYFNKRDNVQSAADTYT